MDVPHFVSQIISFCIVAVLALLFAYKPHLGGSRRAPPTHRRGPGQRRKIKGELARTEAARLEVLEPGQPQANKLIEEARAAAARVQEQETQKAIAAAEQIIAKAREAAAQDHARMLAELKPRSRPLGGGDHQQVTGKVLDAGGPAAPGATKPASNLPPDFGYNENFQTSRRERQTIVP